MAVHHWAGRAYSSPRSDANVFLLIFGWGMFIYAGMVALYFLARALWGTDDQAVPEVDGDTIRPETSAWPSAGHALRPQFRRAVTAGAWTALSMARA
ncbi:MULTISPECIES: hypothetical protein [unclassified Streptomyces]|uniref:hypothetical protein n=1 Tax=unclassified Streptomyces TaxID=2593676 RepID=UPI0038210099